MGVPEADWDESLYNASDPIGVLDLTTEGWLAREYHSHQAEQWFGVSMGAIIFLLILIRWIRLFKVTVQRMSESDRTAMYKRPFTSTARLIQRSLTRRTWGFTSVGKATVIWTYVGLNVLFTFINLDVFRPPEYASRFAWLSLANLVFTCFLALKNTPLSFLLGYSYDRLNGLHQAAGYATIVHMLGHTVCCLIYFKDWDRIWVLQVPEQLWGYVSGGAMFFLPIFGLIRGPKYEIFYASHIILVAAALVTLVLHRPFFDTVSPILTLAAAGLWVADRIVRFARNMYYGINNKANIRRLENGAVRVTLAKGPRNGAGSHGTLWIPGVRPFERHPFTIASTMAHRNGGLEFIIEKKKGFTRSLYAKACKHPEGVDLWASFDGPYGTCLPKAKHFDRVLIIATGTGATFAFGLINRFLLECQDNDLPLPRIDVYWSIKYSYQQTWFDNLLRTMRSHPMATRIKIHLHVTRPDQMHMLEKHADEVVMPRGLTQPSAVTLVPGMPMPDDDDILAAEGSVMGDDDEEDAMRADMPLRSDFGRSRSRRTVSSGFTLVADDEVAGRTSIIFDDQRGKRPLLAVLQPPSPQRSYQQQQMAGPSHARRPSTPAVGLGLAASSSPTPEPEMDDPDYAVGGTMLPIPLADDERAGRMGVDKLGDGPTGRSRRSSSSVSFAKRPQVIYQFLEMHTGHIPIKRVVIDTASEMQPDERLLIAGCGPKKVMDVVQDAAVLTIRPGGAGIDLHLEVFGW